MQTPPPSIFAPTPPPNSPIQWMIVTPPLVINWNELEAAGEAIFNEQQIFRYNENSVFEFKKCLMEVLLRRRLRVAKYYNR